MARCSDPTSIAWPRVHGEAQLVEVRRARREFQDLTGKFEEDEPWFEQRMTLFLEWYVFDRPGPDGLVPADRFLVEEGGRLDPAEREIFAGLTCTQRSLMRIDRWQVALIEMTDMIGGASWSVRQQEPMEGLQRGDLIDARVVPYRDELQLVGACCSIPVSPASRFWSFWRQPTRRAASRSISSTCWPPCVCVSTAIDT